MECRGGWRVGDVGEWRGICNLGGVSVCDFGEVEEWRRRGVEFERGRKFEY